MWRFSWCVPAEARQDKKKDYINTEFPAMTAEEIAHGKPTKSGKGMHPGRGYDKLPDYYSKDAEGRHMAYPCVSIYLKRVKDLFVLDFDGKSKCNPETNSFIKMMFDAGGPYTITAKGYHFYCVIKDTPDFKGAVGIQRENMTAEWGSVDILGRKNPPSSFNCIEAVHHKLVNGNPDFIPEFEWETFSKDYLNPGRMLRKERVNRTSNVENRTAMALAGGMAVNAVLPPTGGVSQQDIPKINQQTFERYIDRLSKENNKRYTYEQWLEVGMMCYNNFDGSDTGFTIWMSWTQKDPMYPPLPTGEPGEHTHRTITYLTEKWATFGEFDGNPITWLSLRSWANEDDPTKNVYQELYDTRGWEAVCEYMNDFIAFNHGTSEVIYDNPEDTADDHQTLLKKVADCKPIFSKWKIKYLDEEGKTKRVNPFNIWIDNPLRRDFVRIVFDPRPDASMKYYNLFKGFEVDATDVMHISPEEAQEEAMGVLNHIKHIWCKGNEDHYNFVMDWFAHIVQRPHIKIGCLICVKSKEGAGKGIIFDFMRHILGRRLYTQINSINDLVSDNNSILEGRLLINGDEVVWGGNIQHGNRLKGLITEPELRINEKYRVGYTIKNTTAFCFSSNEDRCCSAREGDRRSFALELANTWAGRQKTTEHSAYFQNISGVSNSSLGIAKEKVDAFAKCLFDRDLTNFNPRNPPFTEFLTEQIMKNWSPVEKWWYRVLCMEQFPIKDSARRATTKTITEGDYSKNIVVPFDNDQLEYGAISTNWGNGIRHTETSWVNTQQPLYMYAYLHPGEYTETIGQYPGGSQSPGMGFNIIAHWQSICKDLGYPEDIPVPSGFCNMYYKIKNQNSRSQLCKEEYNRNWWAELPELTEKNRDPFQQYKDEPLSPSLGMPTSWAQGPAGKYPVITKKSNLAPGMEWVFSLGAYQPCEGFAPRWDCQMTGDPADWYDNVSRRCGAKVNRFSHNPSCHEYKKVEEELASGGTDYDEYKCDFFHTHQHYIRKGCVDAWQLPDDLPLSYSSDIPYDEAEVRKYCEKWKDGVNQSNFATDLCGMPIFDSQGTQLFHTEKVVKTIRCVYDMEWVYDKYIHALGGGYGGENVDFGSFWDQLEDLLGGEYGKVEGGMFRKRRCQIAGVRKFYWQFVSRDKARLKFQEWANRAIDWGAENADVDGDECGDFM
jgi:hypothetical protein